MTEFAVHRDPLSDRLTPERQLALERLFGRMGDLVSLPTAAQKIVQLTQNDSADANELRDVIQTDPVLVARILRRLNSAYYSLSNRVADIRQAVSLLGIREIRNLALTVYASRMFEKPGDHGTYKRKNLWVHSVAVGAAARLVARVCGRANPDEVYIAGLQFVAPDGFADPADVSRGAGQAQAEGDKSLDEKAHPLP